jgi:hypothetical protein
MIKRKIGGTDFQVWPGDVKPEGFNSFLRIIDLLLDHRENG